MTLRAIGMPIWPRPMNPTLGRAGAAALRRLPRADSEGRCRADRRSLHGAVRRAARGLRAGHLEGLARFEGVTEERPQREAEGRDALSGGGAGALAPDGGAG